MIAPPVFIAPNRTPISSLPRKWFPIPDGTGVRRGRWRAIESFAGVGYFFDLGGLDEGARVIDLGSGSGMDVFFAAELAGPSGHVVGIDFTAEQLDKGTAARRRGYRSARVRAGRIENLQAER